MKPELPNTVIVHINFRIVLNEPNHMTTHRSNFFSAPCSVDIGLTGQHNVLAPHRTSSEVRGTWTVPDHTLRSFNKTYRVIRHANGHNNKKKSPPAIDLRKRQSSLTTLYQRS